jgi:hypothetical protein
MEKELEIKLRGNFEKALNDFNFVKVHDVMNYLDWTWGGNEHNPSQKQMIVAVEELFEHAIERSSQEFTHVYHYSGGFRVTIYNNGKVNIQFVVEETESPN